MIQQLIYDRFGVFYIAQLLKNLGFSYPKAAFVSDHLDEDHHLARHNMGSASAPRSGAKVARCFLAMQRRSPVGTAFRRHRSKDHQRDVGHLSDLQTFSARLLFHTLLTQPTASRLP